MPAAACGNCSAEGISCPVRRVRSEHLQVAQKAQRSTCLVGGDIDEHAVQVPDARFLPVRAGHSGGAVEGHVLRRAPDVRAAPGQGWSLDEDGDAASWILAGSEVQVVADQPATLYLGPGCAHL